LTEKKKKMVLLLDKQRMREDMKRKDVTSDRKEASKIITEKILGIDVYKEAKMVMMYAPTETEVDISELLHHALTHKILVLPAMENGVMQPKIVLNLQLKKGTYGIREPEGENARKQDIDLVLVPGVAFDQRGFRLGHGRGYYDRFLADYQGNSLGVAFDRQIFETLPVEEHDQPVKQIITDRRTLL
jgi:5-formyltetrahydrofolate cyclo-ligase